MKIRCSDAVAFALTSNSSYAHIDWARQTARECARREFEKSGICRYLLDIHVDDARRILQDNMDKVIRSQRPSGGWRLKDSRRITYFYLRAFKHCQMSEEVHAKLRRDPIDFLVNEDDLWAVAAQQRFQGREIPQRKLDQALAPILREQLPNGSWDNTIIATTHHLELLSEACIRAGHKAVTMAVDYILSQLQPEILSEDRHLKGRRVAKNMFSVVCRTDEFKSAAQYKQEWNPVGACYKHIPNMQNSYALRVLNSLGFQNDKRVLNACDNLVLLRENYGGFCETNLRVTLLGK
jgi:hypothetical protein